MARLRGRAEEVRELPEGEPLAPSLEEPSGEPDGVDDRGREAAPGKALDLTLEEPDVEASVVRNEGGVAREREKAADGELGPRRATKVVRLDPGQRRDAGRKYDPRVDERLERLVDGQRANAHGADLAHAVAACREPGRLEVEDDELGVFDEDVGARVIGQTDSGPEPGEARVTVDDAREQAVRESRRRTLESEQDSRGILGRNSPSPCLNELDEPVGGVERELHGSTQYRTYVRYSSQDV
jgi:hypothetical protein